MTKYYGDILQTWPKEKWYLGQKPTNIQAGFKSDVHGVGVVQVLQRHDQVASHISLHR